MARKHLDAIRRAIGRRAAADVHLEDAVYEAKESGETVADIAQVVGLGRTKIYELINKAKARREG